MDKRAIRPECRKDTGCSGNDAKQPSGHFSAVCNGLAGIQIVADAGVQNFPPKSIRYLAQPALLTTRGGVLSEIALKPDLRFFNPIT